MKQNPLKLPLIGGGIAFLCFFLPWIKIDLSSLDPEGMLPNLHKTGSILGIQPVIGGATFAILIFLSTLVILGVCLYMIKQQTPWKARMPVLICSGFGVLYFLIGLILYVILSNPISSKLMVNGQTGVNIGGMMRLQIGIYGAAIGFVMALIGAWNIPKSDVSIQENEEKE